ncbi:cryptochrome/photolyase family protein [Nostoc sp.]
MTIGVWVLGDQLWAGQSALESCLQKHQQTPVIFIEISYPCRATSLSLAKTGIGLVSHASLCCQLPSLGFPVTYAQSQDFNTPLLQWIEQYQITELRVMTPRLPFCYINSKVKLDN